MADVSDLLGLGAGLFFGSSKKTTVNYRGDVLSDQDRARLFGQTGSSRMAMAGGGSVTLPYSTKGFDPVRASEMFANWLTGGKPPSVDPSLTLARSAAMSGVYQKAGAGRGVSGLFGLGKILGGGYSPMQAGTPYSVPPVPNLIKPGGGR